MANKDAQKKVAELRQQIERHNHLYHTLDQPEISDFEYDQLFNQLLELEEQYPHLQSPDSPTQKVGGEVLEAFEKRKHREPMLSLQNTYSQEEIIEFEKKIQRQLNEEGPIEFYCSPKFDGIAMELVYLKGILSHAITRGDGTTGEDVLSNVKTISAVPARLKTHSPPARLDVRGEILLFKKEFLRINKQQEENQQRLFANPRNAAAGTLRQLDSKIARQRKLHMFCYSLGYSEGIDFDSQHDFEDYLNSVSLPIMPFSAKKSFSKDQLCLHCRGADQVIEYYKRINELRPTLDFEIDGIVVKVNSFKEQRSLGHIARSPRWAFAAKFTPEQAITTINDIAVQVGRTGALTPVAIMNSVEVGGVTITHATLHNQQELDRKDVRVGDTVTVHRAGDVIPEILSVDLNKRPKKTTAFKIPDECPVCSHPATQEEGEAVKRCTNRLCPAVVVESIKHFVSRNALNIDHLGSRLIEVFYENKLISSFSDIYKLSYDDIIALERQGEKSTLNLLNSIENSKQTDLHRLIYGLGIRFVGEQTARILADYYKSMQSFLEAKEAELLELPDIGPKVTESIRLTLKQKSFHDEIAKLTSCGVNPVIENNQSEAPSAQVFTDMSFVVTGTLPIPRNEVQDMIRKAGGKISSSVSKNTSVLVAGEKAGSKLEKAEKLQIEIWSWNDLQVKLSK